TSCGALGCNVPGPYNNMVGQEIDLGIYNNGRLIDFIGDELAQTGATLPDTVLTSCLFHASVTTEGSRAGTATNSSVQLCGGGWDAQLRLANGTYTGTGSGIFPGLPGQFVLPYQ